MNKIIKTRVGDEIHYYVNGVESYGVVAKMSNSFVTIFKEDGLFYEVPLTDTFFVKDILINKTWNNMSMEERADELVKIKAYSPRFLSKSWEQLPPELKSILIDKKHGAARSNRGGVPDNFKMGNMESLIHSESNKPPSKKIEADDNTKYFNEQGKQISVEEYNDDGYDKLKADAVPKKGAKQLPQSFQSQSMISANRGVGNEKQLKEYDNYDNKHGLTSRTDRSRSNPLRSSSFHQLNAPAYSEFETTVSDRKTPKGSKSPKDTISKLEKALDKLSKMIKE